MIQLLDIAILLFFLIEVFTLINLERSLWKTYYTPFNILAVPYTVVLLLTIILTYTTELNEFYFPSIFVWAGGLLVFFIPSLLLAMIHRPKQELKLKFQRVGNIDILTYLTIAVIFVYALFLRSTAAGSVAEVGSDDFASESSDMSLFSHVRVFLMSLLMLWIYLYEARRRVLPILFCVIIMAFGLVYQVKSWVIIPFLGGLLLRIVTGKTKLRLLPVLIIVVVGLGVFFLSYYLSFVVAAGLEYSPEMQQFLINHAYHYITSGTMGLSQDLQFGITERPSLDPIFTAFINIYNSFAGEPLVTAINPNFINTGITGTNVRTMFGTLYVHGGVGLLVAYTLSLSTILYSLLIKLLKNRSIFTTAIYAWLCSLLFMGWFELYFQHLITVEIVIFLLLLAVVSKLKLR